jgi:hypothetical protein
MRPLRQTLFVLALVAAASSQACGGARKQGVAEPKVDGPSMNARRLAQLQKNASKDLGCPVEKLTHAYLGENDHAIRGCDKEGIYTLKCMMGSCRWSPDVRARAEFDLDCPRAGLQVTVINETTRGVSGCGKRGTYVISQMWDAWILNSTNTTTTPTTPATPAATPAATE